MKGPGPETVAPPADEPPGGRVGKDLLAGLINAVVSVPDGFASAALAGVNPVDRLYTTIAAAISGSLLVSKQLMQVATTSASALAAGQAISGYPEGQRDEALFLVGIWLAIARRWPRPARGSAPSARNRRRGRDIALATANRALEPTSGS